MSRALVWDGPRCGITLRVTGPTKSGASKHELGEQDGCREERQLDLEIVRVCICLADPASPTSTLSDKPRSLVASVGSSHARGTAYLANEDSRTTHDISVSLRSHYFADFRLAHADPPFRPSVLSRVGFCRHEGPRLRWLAQTIVDVAPKWGVKTGGAVSFANGQERFTFLKRCARCR